MKKFFSLVVMLLWVTASAVAQDEPSSWHTPYEKITYSELRALIESGDLAEARVLSDGWWVTVKTKEGEYYDIEVTPQTPIADHLHEAGVPVSIEHRNQTEEQRPLWLEVFYNLLPLLIFIVFFVFILWFSHRRSRKSQDECLDRAEAINNAFLDRQEDQYQEFIDAFKSTLDGKR